MLIELIKDNTPFVCGREPSYANKTGEWRFLTPQRSSRISPCRQSCLLESEIPLWLEAVKKENWQEAWQITRRYNPFPALTGYVCFHPCTENCNRGELDREIDIRAVEKAIGQWRLAGYHKVNRPKTIREKIAVVGSGPAGMSCAYYLSEAGYRVTVFERSELLGGMFALGIPEYRLPRRVLQKELAILREEGVDFVSSCEIGKSPTLTELYDQFDHVFVATGAWLPRKASVAGEECSGVWNALDFLSLINRGQSPDVTASVVVVGGGNAAIDSARSALRLKGVNHVTLIYRRSRVEMPADPEEVETAEEEGVELIFNALPREIGATGDAVDNIVLDHCHTGREGLVVDCSRSFRKDCGTVIMALGQEADYSVFGNVEKAVPLFAGGDLVSGPATVPEAIRAGRLAALSIRSACEGTPAPVLTISTENPVAFEELNLQAKTNLHLQQREETPPAEAARCLGCGTCNSCGICYLFCPDMAVDITDGRYELNMDYCKGCGICVQECPARALIMEGGR